jgi:hypothetical protein
MSGPNPDASKVPMLTLDPAHPDYIDLNRITEEVLQRAGDIEGLMGFVPQMLRDVIDEVIKTPKTGRRSYDELEKTGLDPI